MSDGCQDTAAGLGEKIRSVIDSRQDDVRSRVEVLVDELTKEICNVSISRSYALEYGTLVIAVFHLALMHRVRRPESASTFSANMERLVKEHERKAAAKLERQLGEFGIDIEPIRIASIVKE
jgi:hypothetical protein